MNDKDRDWLTGRFDRIDDKLTTQDKTLEQQGKAIACLQTKWKMIGKAAALIAAASSISISAVINFLGR